MSGGRLEHDEIGQAWRDDYADINRYFEDLCEGRIAPPFSTSLVLEGDPPAPPQPLVRDWLLDADVNMMVGYGGAFKSTLLRHTGLCLATERPVFGTLEVRRPGSVLLVSPEDGMGVVRMQLDALMRGANFNERERRYATSRIHVVAEGESVSVVRDSIRLGRTVERVGAVAVILDPLSVLLNGSKDDNDVARGVVYALREHVCKTTGAAVIIAHHNRKPARDAPANAEPGRFDALGGGSWIDSARLAFSVVKKGDDVTARCIKANRMRDDIRHELRVMWYSSQRSDTGTLSAR